MGLEEKSPHLWQTCQNLPCERLKDGASTLKTRLHKPCLCPLRPDEIADSRELVEARSANVPSLQ